MCKTDWKHTYFHQTPQQLNLNKVSIQGAPISPIRVCYMYVCSLSNRTVASCEDMMLIISIVRIRWSHAVRLGGFLGVIMTECAARLAHARAILQTAMVIVWVWVCVCVRINFTTWNYSTWQPSSKFRLNTVFTACTKYIVKIHFTYFT